MGMEFITALSVLPVEQLVFQVSMVSASNLFVYLKSNRLNYKTS